MSEESSHVAVISDKSLSSLAFKAVAKDDTEALAGALEGYAEQDWIKWRNRAEQSLMVLCKERAAFRAYSVLAGAMKLRSEVASLTPECDKVVKAFRAVAHDDMSSLAAIIGGMPASTWLRWQNKAKKDLLTMSRERNSKGAYALLKRALVAPLPVAAEPMPVQTKNRPRASTAKSSVAESEVWQDETAHLMPPRVSVHSCDDVGVSEEEATPTAQASLNEDQLASKEESTNEKRLAQDGQAYTKEEFIAFLGAEEAQREWDTAERILEKRLADDGQAYTREEFIAFLGAEEGQRSWDNATLA